MKSNAWGAIGPSKILSTLKMKFSSGVTYNSLPHPILIGPGFLFTIRFDFGQGSHHIFYSKFLGQEMSIQNRGSCIKIEFLNHCNHSLISKFNFMITKTDIHTRCKISFFMWMNKNKTKSIQNQTVLYVPINELMKKWWKTLADCFKHLHSVVKCVKCELQQLLVVIWLREF